jgi:hypothetical protein
LLQIYLKEHEGVPSRLLFRLGGHPKQAGNEPGLAYMLSFAHPIYLPFPNHVHRFIVVATFQIWWRTSGFVRRSEEV